MVEENVDGALPERWTASTVYTDMWMDPDDDPRDTGTEATSERSCSITCGATG